MLRFNWLVRTALLLTIVSLTASAARSETKLRWKFTTGQSFNQKVTQDMNMSMNAAGQVIDTKIVQDMDILWKVESVDAQGIATVSQKFDRIKMKMNIPFGGEIDLDSKSTEEPQDPVGKAIAPAIKALASASFTVKMSELGEILEATMSKEAEDAIKSLPGVGQLGSMFSKDGLINMIKQSSPSFPKDVVEKGKNWSSRMEVAVPMVGSMVSENTFTYQGPKENLEAIGVEQKTSITPAADGSSALKMTVKDQSSSGTILFNNAAGHIASSELTQDMTMQIEVMGQKFDQVIKQKVSMTMTPVKKQ